MKTIGLYKYLPIEHKESLLDLETDRPIPTRKDLLVEVKAISINPVDVKVRSPKENVEPSPKILGWDASGTVVEVGEDCKLFKLGDEVFYSGSITRQGTYSEYHLVDERIVGHKPKRITHAEAAALPLTTITAWEALFERLRINSDDVEGNKEKTILIIGGAGGVGSIAIQLAKWAGLNVVATASREESVAWVRKLGADEVINHYQSFTEQLTNLQIQEVDYILCLNHTEQHWESMGDVIRPQGKICSIVETEEPLNLNVLKNKSVTFVWEFMFTRSMYQTEDMIEQHLLLNNVSGLIDKGVLRSTMNQKLSPINASNLKKAHALVETGRTIGKVVLESF
ncbi:zinc-binding alcohol dehydrogenase family protein [Halalkalibacterium halodurans]|uniref:Zinc-type alcohol dehydrogenase-like protein n=1 Tax=Halalkalibacterium halodurans (strain ATCC BAA-125 / DSM 18197 / FERM 7344 / JCM 9153 / C-125) TaxID=272558 RepID=Q9KEW1_HALH5|nr:zinc-binding alcohol dehydrogenase family protein [Halalkalibacterium halodurans]MED4080364.1 zinc-binding alcohol dehydrogenase family protein [Halalkalibacterium halodurans]MED4084572.1 zinc-binding alcohol dehydrogenase family protein [Halalkalibacterium halodurans]MED4104864.1 zinc-binding alcohol dehydrogenase family protein [Halalkalibacterium halodurans]MED4109695.1 zinc-binding alcohol dehydrogenase family protein [Halalkalibacterium halodurans]MED4122930.1 zinc-binding alcohol dehy